MDASSSRGIKRDYVDFLWSCQKRNQIGYWKGFRFKKSKKYKYWNFENNSLPLINYFDLVGGIFSAEATIRSSIVYKESRGAHQRDDYPDIDNSLKLNFINTLHGNDQKITTRSLKKLNSEMIKIIDKTESITDFHEKLLE